MKTQLCSHCNLKKPLLEFSKDKSRKNGFYVVCKECVKSYQKGIRNHCVDCGIKIWYCSKRCKSCQTKHLFKIGALKPKKITNLIGNRFGYLVVIKNLKNKRGKTVWLCKCDCGKTSIVETGSLNRGSTKSCGCKQFKKGKEHHCWKGGSTKESRKNNILSSEYGITLKDYNKMLKKQNGVCAICGNKEIRKNNKGEIRALSVDHNHKTGKVRALLCGNCNQTLGIFNENIDVLKKMIKYLIKYE